METKELTINELKQGGCFLVKLGKYLSDDKVLFSYLYENNFKQISYRSSLPRGEWVYVNINTKTYRYGTIGVAIVPEVIGNHAIDVEDFILIFKIYLKYKDKNLLDVI